MGFAKAKKMFAECFPDILLDDFVMHAVVSPSEETAMPSEESDVAASHPPEEDALMVTASCFVMPMVVVVLIQFIRATETNITTDQSALLAFRAHIINLNHQHILATNWSSATPLCHWARVTCSRRHNRVTALYLSNMGLVGTIPPDIGNVSFLTFLDISNNSFSGNLPKEMAHLPRLKDLYLDYNKFSTYIVLSSFLPHQAESKITYALMVTASCFVMPMVVVVLIQFIRATETNITTDQSALHAFRVHIINLDFQHILATDWSSATLVCNWAGVTCSRRHNRVTALYLSNMGLVGTIPPDIGNVSFLTFLDISNNSFSGNLPKEMAHLPRLKEMNLGYNEFSGGHPTQAKLAYDILKHSFSSLLRIEVTNTLAHNNIRGYRENLGFNRLTGAIPQSLGHLGLLEILSLAGNHFVSHSSTLELSFLTSLTSCRKLEALALHYNRLNGFLPVSIGNLSTSLERLWLDGNGIMGTIPREIGNLSSLLILRLGENALNGSIPTTIARLQKLQGLELRDNQIGGPIPTECCHMPNFNRLSLTGNQFSGPVPACLGNVSSLRHLYLDGNKFSSRIPESLWSLKDLLELDVSSNSFSGDLPSGLGSLRVALRIDLSVNQFAGNISATIGGLQNLVFLSLAYNTLQGNIPETFPSLISLETLDLSHNKLSGIIPKSLEALSHLSYFNISFNELSGEIPSGGPFENFTGQSFASNEALCGLTQFGVPQCHAVYQSRTAERIIIISVLSAISFTVLVMGVLFVLIRRRKSKRVPTEKDLQPMVHQRITYLEIFEATNGFVDSNLIGSGSSGSV
ncbi:hypothetical protein RJ640_002908 [Escallonia rubra]|uniref:non-specific serine/threonine protein kinase n=1 Tax=Escallonia rubra TaxID=112253 RepID=A0AA88RZY5_9ASTE|nr:hypothetical protein RJ640_002908 [Escallonia rubra]